MIAHHFSWLFCILLMIAPVQLLAVEQAKSGEGPRHLTVAPTSPNTPVRNCGAKHVMVPHDAKSHEGNDFATTSWWERHPKGVRVYTTCVENRDPSKWLWIDWKTPGPHTYVAPGDIAKQPRISTDIMPAKAVAGCLIYGERRTAIRERFLGDNLDVDAVKNEGDCSHLRGKHTLAADQSVDSPWIMMEGRAAMPSNAKEVEGTLIRFVYETGIRPTKDGYEIVLNYSAAAVFPEKFHGEIEGISVRASLDIIRQAIAKMGHEDGIIHLRGYSSTIAIQANKPERFKIANSRLGFFDQYGTLVTEVDIPVLLPATP